MLSVGTASFKITSVLRGGPIRWLILGGTLGNLYDRVVFHGVRDFLHWSYAFDWPVFNIADCCLVSGAFLLLFQAFFAKHEQAAAEHAEQTVTQSAA